MKKSLCILLTAALLSGLCFGVSAATVDAYGEWAAEPTADDSAYTVVSCASEAAAITVPDTLGEKPVVGIAPHAFINNTTMQSLTVPEPVSAIGGYAFLNCEALSAVDLPETLESIGEAAFSGDAFLTDIRLNKTRITAVEAYTFAETALTELTLPGSCTRIGDFAFRNCAALQSLTIPRSVEEIGENAFSGCEQLTICCEESSYAAAYAEEHGIPCAYMPLLYPYLIGDADGDGRITVMDATRIQRLLARLISEDVEFSTLRGDIDGDGLKIFDATAIQRYLVSMGDVNDIGTVVYG